MGSSFLIYYHGALAAVTLITHQPFTAPMVKPEIKYFWKKG